MNNRRELAASSMRYVGTKHHLRFLHGLIYCGLIVIAGLGVSKADPVGPPTVALHQLESIHDPSSAQQLLDGRLLVIEDSQDPVLRLVDFPKDETMIEKSISHSSAIEPFIGPNDLVKLRGLEGLDIDALGNVYALTSRPRSITDGTVYGQEQLVRFEIRDNRIVNTRVITDLRKKIFQAVSNLDQAVIAQEEEEWGAFDIEGLSFDKSKQKLLIGLRRPLLDRYAILITLENPIAAFEHDEELKISSELINFGLKKSGVHAISFDKHLDGYLIVSWGKYKKKKPFKLWFWDGHPDHTPRKVRVPKIEGADHVVDITPVRLFGQDLVLIVFADSIPSNKQLGHFQLLSYEQLEIEPASAYAQ